MKAKSKCLTWLYTLPPDSLVPAPEPSVTYCPTAALSPPAPLAKVTSLDKFCPSTTAPQRVQFLHQVACSAVVDDTAAPGKLRSGKTAYSSPPFSSNSAACPQCGQGGIFQAQLLQEGSKLFRFRLELCFGQLYATRQVLTKLRSSVAIAFESSCANFQQCASNCRPVASRSAL